MKKLVRFFKGLLALILAIVGLLYITDYDYIIKGVRVVYMTGHTTAYIDDYVHFENDTIFAGGPSWDWPKHQQYNQVKPTDELNRVNELLETVAFVIIRNDSIWYESYADDYGRDSRSNSFSMAKSITSAMLGKAIEDGYIKSLDQKVGDFFPQYADDATTVGDLSSMASGLDWDESYKSPFSVTARAYYDDDLAETILNQQVVDTPGEDFTYLSGSTQLLGMVIEKATGKKMAAYLSESFWQPLGMQNDALWQVDDKKNRLAKTYCCIASNALDFARFGRLFKNKGNWNGRQILDTAFVETATVSRFEGEPYGYGFWISNHLDKHIFVMRGILGQYVITVPEDDLIIVRLGRQLGSREPGADFSSDFYKYVEETYAMIGD